MIKTLAVKVTMKIQHDDGRIEDIVALDKEDPTGTFLKSNFSMDRPISAIYDGSYGYPSGYKQDGPLSFKLLVLDATNSGRVF